MTRSALVLLATRGYQATSFSEVIAHSGAPRGSIYHHFPGGKDELVLAALDLAGDQATAALAGPFVSPVDVVEAVVEMWREVLRRSGFAAGCSLAAVTVAAEGAVVERARDVFVAWSAALARALEATGVTAAEAGDFSELVLSSTEGAVLLCRARGAMDPLDAVGRSLVRHAEALAK